jgi:hypothetical protein
VLKQQYRALTPTSFEALIAARTDAAATATGEIQTTNQIP